MYYGWRIVVVSTLSISSGTAPFLFASLGLFMTPFHNEFGWSRVQVSWAIPALVVVLMFSQAVAGGLIDRYGTRAVLLPSLVAFAVGLAAIPILVSNIWHLVLIYIFLGSAGAAANTLPYMKVLTAWFDERRGLAIGLAVSGIGLGYAYMPPVVQYMIDTSGWRAAYFTLSALVLVVVIPLNYLVVRDSPELQGGDCGRESGPRTVPGTPRHGLSAREARKTRRFWLLFALFLCIALVLHGVLPHLVPMLTDKGIESGIAVSIASFLGLAVFASRILIGYLVDRYFAPHVALLFFSLSLVGLGLLLFGSSTGLMYLAAAMIGLSLGAEVDLLAYLVGRYFGIAAYGEIYGLLFVSVLAGTAVGPLVFGFGYDLSGSYSGALQAAMVIELLGILFVSRLPRYSIGNRVETCDMEFNK